MKPLLAASFLLTWTPQNPGVDVGYRVDPPGTVVTEPRFVSDAAPGSTVNITAVSLSGLFPDAPPTPVQIPASRRVKLVIETWPEGEEVASVWVPADQPSGFWRLRIESNK